MVAHDYFTLNPLKQQHTHFQDFYQDNSSDDEETLSFCDLPLTHNNNTVSDSGHDHYQKAASDHHQDFFEFSIIKDVTTRKDDIIFCGKLISYKASPLPPPKTTITIADKEQQSQDSIPKRSKKRSSIFPWKKSQEPKRVSILTTPPMKSRWYLFAFGVGRFPLEMDLSEIKRRQRQQSVNRKSQADESNSSRNQLTNAKGSSRSKARADNVSWGLLWKHSCIN